jgi:nucleoside diphosphate kinase
VWVDFARTQPALLTNICTYVCPEKVQQTLVIIKPDSWRQMSSRPGAIIDMFSRTGLRIIGLKICQISISQALEFYGPVKEVLCRKLAPGVGSKAREILQQALNCQLPPEIEADLAQKVGVPVAVDQFERIIEFMSGVRPSACPPADWEKPGRVKCMALVYEGENAVQKIRDVLGPTDPTKAPSGTVRREFGHDVMVNTAHASDSPENARREMEILRFSENDFVPVLDAILKGG